MESGPGQEDVNVAVKVTFWPATELVGATEIEVPLAWAVVTEPTATKARARINFLIRTPIMSQRTRNQARLRYLDPGLLSVRLGPFGGVARLALVLFALAESLGAVESLAEHPASPPECRSRRTSRLRAEQCLRPATRVRPARP